MRTCTAASTRRWKKTREREQGRRHGGVTSSLNYFRTGSTTEQGRAVQEVLPEVLKTSKGRFHVDYGFHLAPMDSVHNGEVEMLIDKFGVSSFKIFMFYGSHGLHGASNSQREFLMIGENDRYDYAHFEFVMRAIQAAREKMPQRAAQISLSLHCETAEIMTAYTRNRREGQVDEGPGRLQRVKAPALRGAGGVHRELPRARDALPNINLLHLSSRKAVQAALMMPMCSRTSTSGASDHRPSDARHQQPGGRTGQVNPPIRPREDVEFMWQASWPANSTGWPATTPAAATRPRSQALLRQHLDGQERLRRHRIPVAGAGERGNAPRHELQPHGAGDQLEFGAALRPEPQGRHRGGLRRRHRDRRPGGPGPSLQDLASTQAIPVRGLELSARVEETFLRGNLIYQDGNVIGKPQGQYCSPDGVMT